MSYSFTEKKRIRKSFAKRASVLPIPFLLATQLESYAAFLQEAADITAKQELKAFSERMTAIGDQWRNFAYQTARICKARTTDVGNYHDLSALLMQIYSAEKTFFDELKRFRKTM